MIRRIIQIDEEKCNGCGACAAACHESAIGMVDGKAKLLRDDYCDGLATASRHVRPARSHLWREKQRRMTKQPFSRTRKKLQNHNPSSSSGRYRSNLFRQMHRISTARNS